MDKSLEKKVNFLMAYAFVTTLILAAFIFMSFSPARKLLQLEELELKKITIVGEDHKPRMVLSNETRQHPGRMDGKELSPRERPAGILFFNDAGDECGGLVYQVKDNAGKIISGMSFTMDNYRDDQVIQIVNDEYYDNGQSNIERGLKINQYPAGTTMTSRNRKIAEASSIADESERNARLNALWEAEGPVNRLFIGRTRGNSAGLFLAGPDGKPKMMIYVDEKGDPKIQTFTNDGEVRDLLQAK
ncbi:MAG: hypothetical protein K1X47_09225 [Cyclobacteriaceae bacterium]|nr:hypothetical protein [Cyclobacteriaceae bacterium]